MIEPSDFGLFLKEKRKNAQLTQDELASAINKSGQYISNIEKGKNNAPPNPSDIEALIRRLGLPNDEANLFKEKASADRGRLPIEQMDYLMKHALFHEIIDPLDEEWQVIFKNAYLVLKEIVDLNIAAIETR